MTMKTHPSLDSGSKRPMTAIAFTALALLGMSMACSGNTYLGGGESTAGAVGTGGAGTFGQGGNGAATTGTGLPAQGGATSTSADCALIECFRNVQCVTSCGGPVVQDGCCPCPSGSFDSIECRGVGGASATGGATGVSSTTLTASGSTGKGGAAATGGNASKGGAVAAGGVVVATGGTGGTGNTGSTKGGSTATGGAASKGGAAGASANCNEIQCFRAVDCVERCGGPVLQSGCCPCPSGTFDSIQCSGAGGSSSTGGATGKGGATAAGGANSGIECKSAADCQVIGDCCGCYAFGPGQSSSCPMECLTSLTCSGFDPQPTPLCVAGHCVLNRSCDDSRVTCKRATPQCDPGKLPSLTPDGTCWDGNCIDIIDCSEVTGCDVCKANGLLCVYDNGVRGVAHCVPKPYDCMAMSSCSCFSSLCGSITPCADTTGGISCGGG